MLSYSDTLSKSVIEAVLPIPTKLGVVQTFCSVSYSVLDFLVTILLAWIERYIKHDGLDNSFQVKVGDYTIETETHVLSYYGRKEKILSNTEFAAFKLLWTNKGDTVSRQDLKDSVWKGTFCSDESLNNAIYHLRKSFERDSSIHVDTVRGEGFRMWQDEKKS